MTTKGPLLSLNGLGVSGHMADALPTRGTGSPVVAPAGEAIGAVVSQSRVTVLPWEMYLLPRVSVSSSVKWESSPYFLVVTSMTHPAQGLALPRCSQKSNHIFLLFCLNRLDDTDSYSVIKSTCSFLNLQLGFLRPASDRLIHHPSAADLEPGSDPGLWGRTMWPVPPWLGALSEMPVGTMALYLCLMGFCVSCGEGG